MLLPGTATLPLLDRDEPRFAQATREMMEKREWVIPYFNGEYRFDKPVLTYWLHRAGYALFGAHEFGARLHSVLTSILVALLLYHMGTRWFSCQAGFWGGLTFLTTFQILIHGRLSLADMPMVLCVTASLYALYELLVPESETPSWRWFWLLYGALGFGFLAKGPVALAVPLLAIILYRFVFWRKPLHWERLRWLPGLMLTLAIVAAWGIPALIKTHGLFWQEGMNKHVVERGVAPWGERSFFVFYYVCTAFFSLFPWMIFGGDVVARLRHCWNEKNVFLFSWFVSVYLIFIFYKTQLPHYVLPAFPAFCLLLGQTLAEPTSRGKWSMLWLRATAFLYGAVIVVLIAVEIALDAPGVLSAPVGRLLNSLPLMVSGLLAIAFSVLQSGMRRRFIFCGGCLAFVCGFWVLGWTLRTAHPVVLLQQNMCNTSSDTKFLGYRFQEPSLVFYSNRRWQFSDQSDTLRQFASEPGPRFIVIQVSETKLDAAVKNLLQTGGVSEPHKMLFVPDEMGSGGKGKGNFVSYTTQDSDLEWLRARHWTCGEVTGFNIGRTSWVTLDWFYKP